MAIEARLVYLQVVQHAELTARAERQQSRTIEAPAKRGDILDRHGRILAYSVDADTIYAVPTEIDDPDAGGRRALCARSATARAKDRPGAGRAHSQAASAFVVRAPAGVARAGARASPRSSSTASAS